jgi:hypothetical protein
VRKGTTEANTTFSVPSFIGFLELWFLFKVFCVDGDPLGDLRTVCAAGDPLGDFRTIVVAIACCDVPNFARLRTMV